MHIGNRMNQKSYRLSLSFALALLTIGAVVVGINGCNSAPPGVVLYTDQPKAVVEPIVKQMQSDVRVPINVVYAKPEDAQKGTGLSQQIRSEKGSFKADVYWADSPVAIQSLLEDRVVERVKSTQTTQYPEEYRDKDYRWVGLNGRVRVLLFHKKSVPARRLPKSIASLTLPEWKGRAAIADPRRNGSARYHFTALFAFLPSGDAQDLIAKMKANEVQFLADEAAVVEAVSTGKAAWGVTDSDLAETAMQAGKPVDYLLPDQEAGSTAKAMGQLSESIPTIGTPLLLSPVALMRERPSRVEGQHLYEALVKVSGVTALSRVQPHRLPTHQSLIESPPANRKSHIALPLDINLSPLTLEQVSTAQTKLALALLEVLGR